MSIHVRSHERQTASGKTTTVRAHEREGGGGEVISEAPSWVHPALPSDFALSSAAEAPSWEDEDAEPAGDWWGDDEEEQPDSPSLTRMKDEMRHWRALGIEGRPAVPDTSPLGRVLGTDTQEGADRFARLSAYRDAGYTGPLDQDNRIPDPDDPAEQRALGILASLREH